MQLPDYKTNAKASDSEQQLQILQTKFVNNNLKYSSTHEYINHQLYKQAITFNSFIYV